MYLLIIALKKIRIYGGDFSEEKSQEQTSFRSKEEGDMQRRLAGIISEAGGNPRLRLSQRPVKKEYQRGGSIDYAKTAGTGIKIEHNT